mmetsp:Transcript_98249/g.254081  ORF Transcript_98249/g.254081 Transcript_98249/m.254081 type:complete len:92 (+) Transcript_98249:320-595(+)
MVVRTVVVAVVVTVDVGTVLTISVVAIVVHVSAAVVVHVVMRPGLKRMPPLELNAGSGSLDLDIEGQEPMVGVSSDSELSPWLLSAPPESL